MVYYPNALQVGTKASGVHCDKITRLSDKRELKIKRTDESKVQKNCRTMIE